jgi:uncharacterized protein
MAVTTTTKELFKERMMIRKSDPARASVLGMLIDTVQKSIFDAKREETPADIANAAKKMYAEVQQTILEYKKGNGDTAELENELKILEPYLPVTLSPEAMEKAVKEVLDAIPADQRVMKNIMPKLKDIEGIDMKAAKGIIDKLLQK